MGRRQFVASSVAAAAGAALVRTNTICRTALRDLGVPGAPTVSPTVKECSWTFGPSIAMKVSAIPGEWVMLIRAGAVEVESPLEQLRP